MFKVAVLNIKDIVKYLLGITLIGILIFSIRGFIYFFCLNDTIPGLETWQKQNKKIADDEALMEQEISPFLKIITVGLAMAENVKEEPINPDSYLTNEEKNEEIQEEIPIEEAKTGLETEVITENNTANNKYNTSCYGVNIRNESSYKITEEMLNLNLEINKENILLFHTHTCESYTPSEGYEYQESRYFSNN